MTTVKAKDISIGEVHQLLGFQRQYSEAFAPMLSLSELSDREQQELHQISTEFDSYLAEGRLSEGMVKVLTTFPLLRLAGYHRSPIRISLEENIAEIAIADADTTITGRMDILAISKDTSSKPPYFWVLAIEAKNSGIAASEGLPQLLTYAYKSLEQQETVWGLATNGQHYQFVYMQAGRQPIYQLMPLLSLIERQSSPQILQVLKAIRDLA